MRANLPIKYRHTQTSIYTWAKSRNLFFFKRGIFLFTISFVLRHSTWFKQAKFILDFPRELRLQSRILLPVQLFVWGKRGEKEKALCSYCWILTSASGLWQRAAVECCCLIVRVCSSGTGLCYDDLYCSLISSLGFPLASSPHPPILFTVQPSVILPLSEGAAKLSGTWKQLFFYVWGDTTCSSDRLSLPLPTEAQLAVRQTDFLLLPLPRLLRLVLEEVVVFIKKRKEASESQASKWLRSINIFLTYRWGKRGRVPSQWVCETHWESKSRKKNITMCVFISNTSSLANQQNTAGISTHLGIRAAIPDEAGKKTPSILPVSGSPTLAFLSVRHERLSCQSGDLCWFCCDVFRQGSLKSSFPSRSPSVICSNQSTSCCIMSASCARTCHSESRKRRTATSNVQQNTELLSGEHKGRRFTSEYCFRFAPNWRSLLHHGHLACNEGALIYCRRQMQQNAKRQICGEMIQTKASEIIKSSQM